MTKKFPILKWAELERIRWAWWAWEPFYHYRRLGGITGAAPGSALWLREWYEHVHSEKMIKRMADLGINTAITHFFKGFGLVFEKEEIERTRKFTKLCHEHGIKVIGYTQFRSIYYETFLDEEPKAKEWIQRNEQGNLKSWGSAYYRLMPCINHTEFIDYLKKVIRVGIEYVKLDGFHFDNSYAQPCYCEVCQKKFRKYLEEKYPSRNERIERFGLPHFKHMRIPPFQAQGPIRDPLRQEWIRFRCLSLSNVWREIYLFIKKINPDIVILSNPAYPRGMSNWANERSIDPSQMGRWHDLMFAENGNFPRVENGYLITQIRAYKSGRAAGYGVISTTWLYSKSEKEGALPSKEEQVELSLAEAAAFGGIVGTNWALRPYERGERIILDDERLEHPLRRYLSFLKKHENLYLGRTLWSDVCILYSFPSLAFDFDSAYRSIVGFEQTLIQYQIPYSIVFSDNIEKIKDYDVLILADQPCLSNHECEIIQEFVEDGGGLILTGRSGQYNEDFCERIENCLERILKYERVIYLPEAPEKVKVEHGSTLRVPLPEKSENLVRAIEKVDPGGLPLKVYGSQYLGLDVWELPSGARTLHLVNYDNTYPLKNVRIDLYPKIVGNRSRITLYSPDQKKQELKPWIKDADKLSLLIPKIETYAVVVCQ